VTVRADDDRGALGSGGVADDEAIETLTDLVHRASRARRRR